MADQLALRKEIRAVDGVRVTFGDYGAGTYMWPTPDSTTVGGIARYFAGTFEEYVSTRLAERPWTMGVS